MSLIGWTRAGGSARRAYTIVLVIRGGLSSAVKVGQPVRATAQDGQIRRDIAEIEETDIVIDLVNRLPFTGTHTELVAGGGGGICRSSTDSDEGQAYITRFPTRIPGLNTGAVKGSSVTI